MTAAPADCCSDRMLICLLSTTERVSICLGTPRSRARAYPQCQQRHHCCLPRASERPGYPNKPLLTPCIPCPSSHAANFCIRCTATRRGDEPEGRVAHLQEVPTVQQPVPTRSAKSLLRSWDEASPEFYASKHGSRRSVTNRITGNRNQCCAISLSRNRELFRG